MLRPLRFLWKQMNGPQVTAIFTALFRWMQDTFNGPMDYLRHFSIGTSNDAHLTLIGAILGVIRPTVIIPSSQFFLFTRDLEKPSDHGFSDLSDLSIGGQLSDLEEDLREKQAILCPPIYYRTILEGFAEAAGQLFSVHSILTACCNLWQSLHPDLPMSDCPVRIRWYDEMSGAWGATRTHGDVEILLGNMRLWGDDDTALAVQASLQGVFRGLIGPQVIVDVNFDVTTSDIVIYLAGEDATVTGNAIISVDDDENMTIVGALMEVDEDENLTITNATVIIS